MNSQEHDQIKRDVSFLLSATETDAAPPDAATLTQLSEETLKVFMAASARTKVPSRSYRLMHLKTLKWLIPATVAAAVVLAVGLWSGIGRKGTAGSGRVYALSDVPSLMDGARTLHLRWHYYHPAWAPPEQERETWTHDYWVDQLHLSWCRRESYGGKRPATQTDESVGGEESFDPREPYGSVEFICDGEYVMVVNHAKKTVTYEKPTPFKLRYKVRHEREGAMPITAEMLEGCTYVGEALLDGRPHQVWEHVVPPYGDGRLFRHRLWFSPERGEVTLIRTWVKSPKTNDQWVEGQVFDLFERDVEPPPGIFSSEPPAGYELVNTKETAQPDTLDTCSTLGRVGQRTAYAHVSYELPGRVLLFGWSCLEQGGESTSQAELFEGLVPGGPLPELPLEIHTWLPNPRMGTLAWIGRHLAHTLRNGRHYAWSLYVPNQTAPLVGPMGYEGEYRLHPEGSATLAWGDLPNWGAGDSLRIRNKADFDEFVLGAMAELSDSGAVPDYVNYEYVMELSEQIRSSLETR